MIEVAAGIRRVTFPLPLGIDHVHCYLLEEDEGWMLVDTGLGVPGASEAWAGELGELGGGRVSRIFVTHFHPDHVGGAAVAARVTGAPVLQGRLDFPQCEAVWGAPERSATGSIEHLLAHGMPEDEAAALGRHHLSLARHVQFAAAPVRVDAGDLVGGWEAIHLPGHADGHLGLWREGVLVAGDALLGEITPNIGLYPNSAPDPLAAYLETLRRIVELAPSLALPGHGPVLREPAARAAELLDHHRERLELTAAAVEGPARSAYDVSLVLWPGALSPPLRRFALGEALAHLVHLVGLGEARHEQQDRRVLFSAP